MRRLSWLGIAAVVFAGVACKKEEKSDPAPVVKDAPKDTPKDTPKEPPKAERVTGEALAKRGQEFVAAMGASNWDAMAAMYAPGAKVVFVDGGMEVSGDGKKIVDEYYKPWIAAFTDIKHDTALSLVSGSWTADIATTTSKHTGELMGMKPSNVDVVVNGLLIREWTDDGKIKNEWHFADGATLGAQIMSGGLAPKRPALAKLSEKPIIAADDQKEKDNLATWAKSETGWEKEDLAIIMADTADDFVNHDMVMPNDVVGKAENEKMMKEGFGAFTTTKWTNGPRFAAGDYVIAVGTWEAKNDGDMPSMGMKATNKDVKLTMAMVGRFEGGKLKEMWGFSNGAAFMQQLGIDPAKMMEMMTLPAEKKGKGK